MKRKLLLVFLIGVGIGAGGVLLYQYLWRANIVRIPSTHPAAEPWAQPLGKPGLKNLHRVSKDLYRGAQPTTEGFRQLKAMGVRTVVNLRSFSSDRDGIGETGLGYEHIYSKAWHVEANEVVRFLQIVTDPARTPVFVHCKHGSDRTGTMCAIYRVAVQGWSKEDAIEEMTRGGFGFHQWFDNLIEFVRELDIEDMKRRAGLTTRPATRPAAARPLAIRGPLESELCLRPAVFGQDVVGRHESLVDEPDAQGVLLADFVVRLRYHPLEIPCRAFQAGDQT